MPVKLSNADYWRAYWGVGRPVRAGRLRRAVKMATPQDVAGLWAAVRENPHDQARWLIAADALDEMGKGGAAKLFRTAAQVRPSEGRGRWMDTRTRRGFDMNPDSGPQNSLFSPGGHDVYGHVAGIYVRLHPMTDVCHVMIGSPVSESATGYGWVTHDIGRELMADLDGPYRGEEAGFRRLKAEYAEAGPEKMRRPRRLSRADIPGLYARAWENVKDAAPWGVLADALDESGKPHAATIMRGLAERAPGMEVDPFRRTVADVHMGGESFGGGGQHHCHGRLAGLPVTLWPLGKGEAWGAYLHHPDSDDRAIASWNAPNLWLRDLPPETGVGALHEIEHPLEPARADAAKKDFPLPGAEKMARRPVRNATPQDHQAMRDAIKAVARKRDVAPILGYADMLQEDGHDHLADGLRRAAVWITDRRGKSLKSPLSSVSPAVGLYGRHRSGITHPALYLYGPDRALVTMSVGGKKLLYEVRGDADHLRGLVGEMEAIHDNDGYYGARATLDRARRYLGMGPWAPPAGWHPTGPGQV